ncbi:hypothetical protein QR680_012878 [Steinernema hermaphroditum]|uniref:Uncharacterized protein n=1 Tax=Steinernema hermaphroditum TaxID=289476 RepID=A0AA39I6F1_9BILA|nr:hypothetical protein QR680_012878 [Steinernema hermaphroditum]
MEPGRLLSVLLVFCCLLFSLLTTYEASAQSIPTRPMQMKRFYSWEEGKRSADAFPGDFDAMPLERMFKRRFYAWASHFQKRHAPSDVGQP